MPSGFAALARSFLQPAYALHRQPFTWAPMMEAADVNAPTVPDPSRPGGVIQGAFFDKPSQRLPPRVYDLRADRRPGDDANVPRIEFAPPASGAPPDVRRPDLLTDENGIVWRVEKGYARKTGVLVCEVNAIA